ncbi:MAG: hypothetical protein K0R38_7109 [Polyangiaceae bacterium]|nr:hypothetical protein [Polyangiaceae bacterium]
MPAAEQGKRAVDRPLRTAPERVSTALETTKAEDIARRPAAIKLLAKFSGETVVEVIPLNGHLPRLFCAPRCSLARMRRFTIGPRLFSGGANIEQICGPGPRPSPRDHQRRCPLTSAGGRPPRPQRYASSSVAAERRA